MTDQTYPHRPGYRVSGSSEEAADAIAPVAPRIRDVVLAEITRQPGQTADEVAANIGMSVLTVRPRVSELKRLGEIEATTVRRCNASGMTASTWRVAPPLPNNL